MNSFMSICLKKNGSTPIYRQLGDALLCLISEGILEPDGKLPPIRKMAESLRINSSTVVSAYKYLEEKHAVYSMMGSGTYVAPMKPNPSDERQLRKPIVETVAETGVVADFVSDMLSERFFPIDEIKQAFDIILHRHGAAIFSPISRHELKSFFDEVAVRLATDGIYADSANILTAASLNEAIELAASAVVNKGDHIIIEKPSVYFRAGIYSGLGANILQAPLAHDGIDLNILESLLKIYRPKAVHVSTYYQTPTNACYSHQNKKTLLELCCKYGAVIIEEDVFGRLARKEKRIFLKSLDYRGRVIYVKSLTKICLPSFNVNICVFPGKYIRSAEKSRDLYNAPINTLQIRLLRELLLSEQYEILTEKIVKNHQAVYENNAEIIDDKLGKLVEYDIGTTGTGFWLRIKKGSALALARRCAARGVVLIPGNVYFGGGDDFFRICAGADTERFTRGIEIIKEELTTPD